MSTATELKPEAVVGCKTWLDVAAEKTQLLERLEVWEATRGNDTREFLVLKLCPGQWMVKYGPDWSLLRVVKGCGWVGWRAVRAASSNTQDQALAESPLDRN